MLRVHLMQNWFSLSDPGMEPGKRARSRENRSKKPPILGISLQPKSSDCGTGELFRGSKVQCSYGTAVSTGRFIR